MKISHLLMVRLCNEHVSELIDCLSGRRKSPPGVNMKREARAVTRREEGRLKAVERNLLAKVGLR